MCRVNDLNCDSVEMGALLKKAEIMWQQHESAKASGDQELVTRITGNEELHIFKVSPEWCILRLDAADGSMMPRKNNLMQPEATSWTWEWDGDVIVPAGLESWMVGLLRCWKNPKVGSCETSGFCCFFFLVCKE